MRRFKMMERPLGVRVDARRRRRQQLLRVLWWVCISFIAVTSLVPGALRPSLGIGDKAEHFAAYFLATALAFLAYQGKVGRVAALLAVAAIVFEALQLAVPGRSASILDFAASLAGIGTALTLREIGRRLSSRE